MDFFAQTNISDHRAANKEQELKRLYRELIDDENRQDLAAVRELVWSSSSMLFVAKAPVGWRGYWGINDVMQHLHDMYQTPFRIDPNYDEEKVVFITPEIAETYAPVRITVAYGGIAKGVEAILKRARTIVDLGANVEIQHVVMGYEGVVLLLHNTGKRNGRILDEYLTTVCTLRDGKIARLDTYISDIAMVNAYFA